MPDLFKRGLTNHRPSPKDGSVQSFDTTSKETAAENATNSMTEHKVEGPKSEDLGAKNKLGK